MPKITVKLKPLQTPNPVTGSATSPEELLKKLMGCFYWNGYGIEWSYIEGTTISNVISPDAEKELRKYMSE